MNRKIVGSILMILGTTIGAAMLALPVVTAHENYLMSLGILLTCWIGMTLGAFCLLEVNLWLESGTNLTSMARATLGKVGSGLTWVIYMLLLYSLICAYLSGSSDIVQELLRTVHIVIPAWAATILTLFLLGIIVYRGIGSVDLVNRGLMGIKFLAYIILVICIAPYIHLEYLSSGDYLWRNETLMVVITAFGYAIILPSLRSYLKSDRRVLIKVVFIGSLLPLIIYSLWILVIQGLVPRTGEKGLIAMLTSSHTNSLLMASVSSLLHNPWVSSVAKLFISICALTSFLGVSICLTDFIADGFKLSKYGPSAIIIYTISYLPPLCLVLLAPGIFIKALSYAGIWCIILLILLPLLMLYFGRYHKKLGNNTLVPLNRPLLILCLIIVIGLLLYQFINLGS